MSSSSSASSFADGEKIIISVFLTLSLGAKKWTFFSSSFFFCAERYFQTLNPFKTVFFFFPNFFQSLLFRYPPRSQHFPFSFCCALFGSSRRTRKKNAGRYTRDEGELPAAAAGTHDILVHRNALSCFLRKKKGEGREIKDGVRNDGRRRGPGGE